VVVVVVDGHGKDAVALVQRVKTEAVSRLDAAAIASPKALLDALRDDVVHADRALAVESGMTMTVCTMQTRHLSIAYVGDSLAALLSVHRVDSGDWTLAVLTPPHRLSTPSERSRVTAVNPAVDGDVLSLYFFPHPLLHSLSHYIGSTWSIPTTSSSSGHASLA